VAVPADIREYEIYGTLFKRRGGVGRILGYLPRLFTLYQGAPGFVGTMCSYCVFIGTKSSRSSTLYEVVLTLRALRREAVLSRGRWSTLFSQPVVISLGCRSSSCGRFAGKLCYYEDEIIEDVDRSRPRGVFNLEAPRVTYVIHEPVRGGG
jgi:hypothetical protein